MSEIVKTDGPALRLPTIASIQRQH